MGLQTIWNNYKVLIVMGTSLGLIHWGWTHTLGLDSYTGNKQDYVPEPGIVKGQHLLGYIVD
uniref:Uncharacterized protein n=1 Tax=Salmo trutta TaxID=8032 RepID=A0A674AD75_SALTR